MLSVGQFAKKAKVTTRTVRFYESIGLLPAPSRGENNYRYYDQKWLHTMDRIRDLQSLGFSLQEVKSIISFSNTELKTRLEDKLLNIAKTIEDLQERQKRLNELLSVSQKIEQGILVTQTERNLYMEAIQQEVINGLHAKYDQITDRTLHYLSRESWLNVNPQIGEYIEAVKKCIEFAKNKNLILGTARGSSSASLSLYGLGISGIDPLKYEMIPERLSTQTPFFHIDVEYERGQEFVDYCREMNKSITYGEIQAFKMPLIDIIQNVHKSIGQVIDYDAIQDDSDIVLNPFRNFEIENIFQFDFSKDALVMNYERFTPEFLGLNKITHFLKNYNVASFRDIINITALWRPHCSEIIQRIELYRKANQDFFSYGFLSDSIEHWLKPNYGVILYHEDLIKIISEYTGWDFARSNSLRRLCFNPKMIEMRNQNPDWKVFNEMAPPAVVDLVAEESKWTFCLPHAVSFSRFTKQTAILKSIHKDVYISEIEKFEQTHGVTWDDIGIRIKGVSLHQG